METLEPSSYQAILKGSQPYVIKFFHPLCSHCRNLAPHFVHLAKQFEGTQRLQLENKESIQIQTAQVDCSRFPQLCRGVFPTIELIQSKERQFIGYSTIGLEMTLLQALQPFYPNSSWTQPFTTLDSTAPQHVPEGTLQDRIQDAQSALMDSLTKNVIFLPFNENAKEVQALQNYLHVVAKSFPQWHLHDLWQNSLRLQANVTQEEWMQVLQSWTATRTVSYSRCAHSSNPYTCGQWTLFHLMVMNPNEEVTVLDYFLAIRSFVQYFLQCPTCQRHFLDMTPSAEFTPLLTAKDSTRALQLYLWEKHNRVNARLNYASWPANREVDPDRVLQHLDRTYRLQQDMASSTRSTANSADPMFSIDLFYCIFALYGAVYAMP